MDFIGILLKFIEPTTKNYHHIFPNIFPCVLTRSTTAPDSRQIVQQPQHSFLVHQPFLQQPREQARPILLRGWILALPFELRIGARSVDLW